MDPKNNHGYQEEHANRFCVFLLSIQAATLRSCYLIDIRRVIVLDQQSIPRHSYGMSGNKGRKRNAMMLENIKIEKELKFFFLLLADPIDGVCERLKGSLKWAPVLYAFRATARELRCDGAKAPGFKRALADANALNHPHMSLGYARDFTALDHIGLVLENMAEHLLGKDNGLRWKDMVGELAARIAELAPYGEGAAERRRIASAMERWQNKVESEGSDDFWHKAWWGGLHDRPQTTD